MQWRAITGFPNYVVSNEGVVRNIKFERDLAYSDNIRDTNTYKRVTLFIGNKRYYKQVHRLVAEAFIPNPLRLPQVDHKDNNGSNNTVDNLQWVTCSENIQKAFQQNNRRKLEVCASGGKASSPTTRLRSENKHKTMLGDRFIKFHHSGSIYTGACVTYKCLCGIKRTAGITWKELRVHLGKCPVCTNTIKRSNNSILEN